MFCRNCGKELTGSPEICLGCGAKPLHGADFCQQCGAPTTPLTEVCVNCGGRVAKDSGSSASSKSAALAVGGVLVIICGILGVVGGLANLFKGAAAPAFGDDLDHIFAIATGAVQLILGPIAIVGGAYALKQRKFALAVFGAVCGLLAALPLCLGVFLGLAAIVLIVVSRGEFDEHK
jgi:hypothetical protein